MNKIFLNFAFLVILMLGSFVSNTVHAQIAGWSSFEVNETQRSLAATLVNENLIVGTLDVGSGLTRRTFANAYVVSQNIQSSDTTSTGEVHAIDNNQYFEFKLTAKNGYKLSLNAVNFKMRATQQTRFFLLRYSIPNVTEGFINAAPRQQYAGTIPGSNNSGLVQPSINLSGIENLKNIPAGIEVTFRLYYNGSTNLTTATGFGVNNSLTDYGLSISGDLIPLQSILAWQFANPKSNGNEETYNSSFNQLGLESAALTRGAGLRNTEADGVKPITYPGAFVAGATVATIATSSEDIADAIANDLYFGFEINPSENYKVSLSKLRTKVRASGGGAKTWLWRYSTDNVNFSDLGTAYYNPNTATGGVYMPEIDLSAIPTLQNLLPSTTVYFRLYLQGSNGNTGSSGIGISLNENGYALSLDGTVESTLPVELTSFTGELKGNNVQLNWQTASERDNSHFEVLRLENGKIPQVLGVVNGNSNSSQSNYYSFTDYSPSTGTNYYQLRQVDFNGSLDLSNVVFVNANFMGTNNMYITDAGLNGSIYTEKQGDATIILSDLSGRVILNKSVYLNAGQNSVSIPIQLKKGIYVASIYKSSSKIFTKKIIK